ncbi:hypothetical protein Rleg9DRAFT_7302 [Rhizobium leguminosarum bv. trifolii WSM597]|uniref:Double-GTPase 2 domain-containing protein n=2 Tax=Rhizobium leguminosarum TaxID=384 RepID=I9N308_RHILT|nr:hypothetical protein Rleg9DRAFT_1062 [Rhizobium leguminosarum bv. trifolii WSM597]EJB08261.1 hypothetical protein Rleg9DRAFT_7302 [Rhizobium leguminosarum bv. trifolii WSM597]
MQNEVTERVEAVEDDDTLDPGEEFETPVEATGLQLRSNDAISQGAVSEFRGNVRTKTVVLVGEQKAGKTTLLASLFGQFCDGPVGRFTFAESRTLLAFSERRHLALRKSQRKSPSAPRTSRAGPVHFFHLCVADEVGERFNILISDRSGEAFDAARRNTQLLSRLEELPMADFVCFLLDAGKLTNKETRAGYKRKFRETIRALNDNGVLPSTAKIEILVTKLDKLQRKGVDLEALEEVARYEADLRTEFAAKVTSFEIYQVCALPRANLETGVVGLSEMVDRWCLPDPVVDPRPMPVRNAARYLDRLVGVWT